MTRRTALLMAAVVAGSFLVVPAASATPRDAAGAFVDDDGIVHEPNINGIQAAGITKGCDPPANDRFCPTRSLTRAELATLFVRAFDLPPAPPAGFQDTAGTVHRTNIDALAAAGITSGCNPAGTLFCPQRVTTRAEMASFLVRALELPPAPSQPFVDVGGNPHRDNIAALAFSGITKGCNPPTNDRFCPDDEVSRAQMASFLVRALPDVSPIFNQLSLAAGIFCSKDGTTCSRRFSAADGIQWEVTDGWYNVLPYLSGERSVFEASNTRLEIDVDGSPVGLSELAQVQTGNLVKRLFTTLLAPMGPGTHTIVARWRWNGNVVRTLTIRVTAN